MKSLLLMTLPVSLLLSTAVSAQPSAKIVSPEVRSDGHVTFRLAAPNAAKVVVSIEGQNTPTAMEKGEGGIWSATVGPLPPDIYGYSLIADGVALIDPSNQLMKPNLLGTQSAVHVPGATPLLWELSDIPHGQIHHHFFHSKIASDDRDFYVYTPPAYDPGGRGYPVLYLLHGFSDDASGWTAVGRANLILDNLIAQGSANPMIVVMPLGYGEMDEFFRGGWDAWSNKDVAWRNLSRFPNILLTEVMPQVEKSYRVRKDRESRAIAGLSMGGGESLITGLNHLDQFAWIGAFSSGGIDNREFSAEFPSLDANANKKLKLLWIACGDDDELIKINRQFKSWLQEKGVAYTDIETPGVHTWMVWRRNLAAFAPLLFR